MLEEFEAIKINTASPHASVTKNGVTFSKAALELMDRSDYVRLLVNRDTKQFAITPTAEAERDVMPFAVCIKPHTASVRWSSRGFLGLLSQLMSWDLKACSGYRLSGAYLADERVLLFDLAAAEPLVRKARR